MYIYILFPLTHCHILLSMPSWFAVHAFLFCCQCPHVLLSYFAVDGFLSMPLWFAVDALMVCCPCPHGFLFMPSCFAVLFCCWCPHGFLSMPLWFAVDALMVCCPCPHGLLSMLSYFAFSAVMSCFAVFDGWVLCHWLVRIVLIYYCPAIISMIFISLWFLLWWCRSLVLIIKEKILKCIALMTPLKVSLFESNCFSCLHKTRLMGLIFQSLVFQFCLACSCSVVGCVMFTGLPTFGPFTMSLNIVFLGSNDASSVSSVPVQERVVLCLLGPQLLSRLQCHWHIVF